MSDMVFVYSEDGVVYAVFRTLDGALNKLHEQHGADVIMKQVPLYSWIDDDGYYLIEQVELYE